MDVVLFLLIILGFLNAGRIFTRKIWGLNFSGPAEAFIFSSALGSVITSVMVTGLAFYRPSLLLNMLVGVGNPSFFRNRLSEGLQTMAREIQGRIGFSRFFPLVPV